MTYPNSLTDSRRKNILKLLEEDLALIPSSTSMSFGTFSFRQESDFYYFTGSEIPNSWLVLDSYQQCSTLYIPIRDERYYRKGRENAFPGHIHDIKEVSEATGLYVKPISNLKKDLRKSNKIWVNLGSKNDEGIHKQNNLTFENFFTSMNRCASIIYHPILNNLLPHAEFKNLYSKIASLRIIKDSYEIERMRKSAYLGAKGVTKAIRETKPGITERELTSVIVAEYLKGGAQRIPFPPVVKSGVNSTYPWPILGSTYNRRNRVIERGDIVIADVGPELDYYVSDVARTFPASGEFSGRQKQVYEELLYVWEKAIRAVKPGVTLNQVEKTAFEELDESLTPWWDPVIGHFIGLDAFDPGNLDQPLEEGMTFTIEPRIYIRGEDLGVMIEDDVLVTKEGAEILSEGAPRKYEEIKKIMKR